MSHAALPLYIQIAEQLKQNIQQQVYQVGDKLPSENELSLQFGVNRHTLRRAIELLKQEGLLRTDRGIGIFVAATPIRYPIGKRVRYNDVLQAQGITGGYQTLQAIAISADSKVAPKLDLKPGDPVALIEMLDLADNQPLGVSSSYFPLHRFPDMVERFQDTQSISKLVREVYGCDHIRLCTHISARLVKPQDARLLNLSLNQPILLIEAVNVDQHGKAIEYTVTRFRGDLMELVINNDLDVVSQDD
ncbi:phosphonate metabolism transcriptional regulator PhnF [Gloeocapsopsis sp. IPPAS B-1203]|uniref:phosphonate metabolism transcriptional regulator PhnF n=1 Tax=Gloeocapsopsis sp. IPPAS B-1203 TaxID=2049454 RepID=UPI000C19B5B5|nr:phosphonate metabolism transcriptional regulator PhnF [Gloeocapsopsis sp. IPPAS B-1203]PIG95417.1 phosphonate metabolism transcriptional regulator PhnF [Gloeocapsopsis sp. IPPAS B-1203]